MKHYGQMRRKFTADKAFDLRFKIKKSKASQEMKVKCEVCNVEFGLSKTADHNRTEIHKELAAVKRHWLFRAKFHKTLDEQIEKLGSDMPLVGLDYIYQYKPNEEDEHIYHCRLCDDQCKARTVFYHVLSIPHRILYLNRRHKSMGIDRKFQVDTREQYMHLMTCTANAFQIDGRKAINIKDEVYVEKVEPETSVQAKKKKTQKNSETKTGPTDIMDVIKNALTRDNRGTDQNRSTAGERKLADRKSQPPSTSSKKQEDLFEMLTAFLESRSQMKDGDSAVQLDDNRPAIMQESPVVNRGPMSHEGAAFRQAGINAPGAPTQNTMMGLAARPGMPQTAKPVAGQPILPKHSTVLRHPASTTPFPTDDQGRSSLELTIAHEANIREMGMSEDLISGSVGEEDPGDSNFFWCNEELYDFLGHLTVENKEDVDNVLKATELFANALVRRKQRSEAIKRGIEMEKKILEIEKKVFLNAPGVNQALQKKTQKEQAKSRSPSPPARGAASKHKATTDSSSSIKTWFPIDSAPANTEPPSKAKRVSLSFDSYRRPGNDRGLGIRQPISGFIPAFKQPSQPMHEQKPVSDQSRTQMNETRTSWNEQRQPIDRSWPFTTGSNPAPEGFRSTAQGAEFSEKQLHQMNRPKPPMNERELQIESRSIMEKISDSEPSGTSWQQQRQNTNQERPSFNEQRLSSNDSRLPFNESRPSYGASDTYTESSAYYKGNERDTGSQYANSGSTAGARSSYGAGAGRPEESDAYYTENENYASSQYSNTGSTGGAKPSYGVGAARQGESDAYEKYTGSQYGNTGSAGVAKSSYGPGAGRPGESDAYYKENERFADSQYGATGGAKSSCGTGAGGIEGSKDNFGFNSGYTVSCPAKYYLNSSTGELQNSQRPDSMGSSYGMNQGNWSSSVPARSDNFPSKGPGAGNVQQQPYSSNQIYII